MPAIVRSLDARLLREREEERQREEARRQAAAFRSWMRLGDRQLDAFYSLAPQVPSPGQLNPIGRAYESARADDSSLRPTDVPRLIAEAPPPAPTPPAPPAFVPQPPQPAFGLQAPTIGAPPAPVAPAAPQLGGFQDLNPREVSRLGGLAAVAREEGVTPQELLAQPQPNDFAQQALDRRIQMASAQILERQFVPPPGVGGLVRAATTSLLQTPSGESPLLDPIGRIPGIGKPLKREVEFLTSGLGLATAGLAPVATAAGAVGGVGLAAPAQAGEEAGLLPSFAPEVAQVVGNLAPAALVTAPGRALARQALRRAPREVAEEAAPVAARAAGEVAEEVAPVAGRGATIPPQAVDDFEAIPREAIAASTRELPQVGGGAPGGFAAPLRPFDDVVGEVVTRDDPIAQVLARSGVSPSLLESSDVGRATVAFARQRGSAEQIINVTLASAVDAHRTGVGRGLPISIGDDAIATLNSGKRVPWNDLFSSTRFDGQLDDAQRAFVNDYRRVVEEAEFLRTQAGLKPRALKGEGAKEGWFYIPRQVRGVRGMELRRPSSPGLQRHYEEAIEGIENGIRYESDPRAVLDLHLRQAYREIAEKQMSDFLEPLSVTAKQLIPEPVLKRMSDAVQRRLGAERSLRGLRAERLRAQTGGKFVGEEAAAQRVVRGAKAPERARIGAAIKEAETELNAAMAQYTTAKTRYTKALEQARKAELAPGNLFGKAEDVIPVAQWRNRFFPLEDAETLNEAIGGFLQSPKRANWVGQGFEQLGNHIRFLSAIGDFAAPFIQGLPLLGRNPVAWGRATLRHYQAFADPVVQSRFIRDHIDTFQEMAQHNVPVGDVEFFKALQEGQGISAGALIERLPKGKQARGLLRGVGKQTFGRFQASYDMFLSSARAQLWESMKPSWKGSLDEMAAHVRNMTGGLDSRALGVGPTQRGFESTWLAFSPRLLRSTVALVADLRLGLKNPRGRAAFQSLGGLVAGTVGIYIASGLALGKSEEEIRTGLNPLEGKKFLSHNINGDWVGVGGQVRAITQLLARSAADPASLLEAGQFDNPLLQFASSRGAPGLRVAQTIGEAATGADLLPFDEVDSLPDVFRHIGQSALPFAVQGLLEGEGAGTFVTGLAGARTSPETPREELSRRFEEKHGRPYDPTAGDATIVEQDEELSPLLFQSEERAEREGFLAEREQELGLPRKAAAVLGGNVAGIAGFNEAYSDFQSTVADAAARDFFGTEPREAETPEGQRYQAYRDIKPTGQRFENPETLEIDWGLYMTEKDAAFARLPGDLQRAIENRTAAQDEGVNRLARQIKEWRNRLDPYYAEEQGAARLRFRQRTPDVDAILWILGSVSKVAGGRGRSAAVRLLGQAGIQITPNTVPLRTGGGGFQGFESFGNGFESFPPIGGR